MTLKSRIFNYQMIRNRLSENFILNIPSLIFVLIQVEYKKPLDFSVKKSADGEPVEFKSFQKLNDKQGINFKYESIVDFTVGVKNRLATFSSEDESLFAEIESKKNLFFSNNFFMFKTEIQNNKVTVLGDYQFQIISKNNKMPIPIKVYPKENNTYRIKFRPLPVSGYVLKAKSLKNVPAAAVADEETMSIGANLNCLIHNPQHLVLNEMVQINEILSFTGNEALHG